MDVYSLFRLQKVKSASKYYLFRKHSCSVILAIHFGGFLLHPASRTVRLGLRTVRDGPASTTPRPRFVGRRHVPTDELVPAHSRMPH
jgi:hypothetical protein